MMNFIKVIYSLVVAATLLSSMTTLASPTTQPQEVSLELNQVAQEIEVHDSFDPNTLVEGGSYQSLDLPIVDTTQVGEQVLVYQANLNLNEVEKQVVLNVVDTTAPEFIKTMDKLTVNYNSKPVNLVKNFEAKDNYDEEVKIKQLQTVKTTKEGKQTIVIEASDASGNTSQHTVVVTVNPKPKPKPKPVVKPKTAPITSNNQISTTASTTSDSKAGVDVRLTFYGANCGGCRKDKNGYNRTALGIYVNTTQVRQNNGTWKNGITYQGRYIVATGKKWPLCTVGKITNHVISGQGISVGQPINVVVADRGVSGNHLDLFVGNEKGFNGVRFTRNYMRGVFIVTGMATRITNGCRF